MAELIPEHVIVRIMERLPIKSLIRFSCVSKRWQFIILSDPHFARSQFQIALQRQTLTHRLLSLQHSSSPDFKSMDLEARDWRTSHCPFITSPGFIRILCSCNGVLCVILESKKGEIMSLYIWNPSTRFSRRLPVPGFPFGIVFYGFGYVSATDNYKFIAKNCGNEMQAAILSLRTNIWENIELPTDLCGEGTLLNETLHWLNLVDREGDPLEDPDIIAFDLDKEEFRRMQLPDIDDDEYMEKFLGASLGGCLCLFDIKEHGHCFAHMWVMREYGVHESWTKLFTLKFARWPENYFYFRPILILGSSTLLETTTAVFGRPCMYKLIKSGHEEQKLETRMVSRKCFEVYAYQETLLRPA